MMTKIKINIIFLIKKIIVISRGIKLKRKRGGDSLLPQCFSIRCMQCKSQRNNKVAFFVFPRILYNNGPTFLVDHDDQWDHPFPKRNYGTFDEYLYYLIKTYQIALYSLWK